MGRTVGIDLGTTFSVVAYLNTQGQAEVIVNREGFRTTPSVFAYTNTGERLVGKAAVDQEAENLSGTVRSIKRHMGTAHRLTLHDRQFSPEEISAEILKKLKAEAESYLGEEVTQAVITVPAYFNSDQRQATKTAGELAGLTVLRVISEPTAAALAYGLDQNKDERVLVYDLGGGTFDVTVLCIDGGIYDVQSTAGDTHLGGDDFDQALMNLLSHKFLETNPNLVGEFSTQEQAARLREGAEQAKKELSAMEQTTVHLPYFAFIEGKPVHFKATVTRQEFQEAVAPLVKRTITCVEQAMKDAKITPANLDEVIFVGGSTRMPVIAEAIEAWSGKKPNRTVNPDEAVALGATVQAAVLSGEREADIGVLDVIPLTLGLETLGGVFTIMIKRNTTIPTEFTQEFTTSEDNQQQVEIRVYQGERPLAKDNKMLGSFFLADLPPAPRMVPQIDVTFRVDANSILSVSAIDKETGRVQDVTISGSASLTAEEIAQMLQDADANAETDRLFLELSNARAELREQIAQIDDVLRDCRNALVPTTIEALNAQLGILDAVVAGEDTADIVRLTTETKELVKKALEEVYDQAIQEMESGL